MKKIVKKKKVFNTFSLILLVIVFIEIILIVNSVSVGNAVKSVAPQKVGSVAETVKTPSCTPTAEICDGKDNNCNNVIDDDAMCVNGACVNGKCIQLSGELLKTYQALQSKNKFIIKLKGKPLAEYKYELDQQKSLTKSQKDSALKSYRSSLVDKQNQLKSILQQKGIVVRETYQNVINGIVIVGSIPGEISQNSLVENIYEDTPVQAFLYESIPNINADDVWNMQVNGTNLTGQGIKIAIIDTGIDYAHPDLGGCYGVGCKVVGGYDFYNNDSDPMDDNGHGTHVAATVAGKATVTNANGTFILNGVAPDATLYAYKALSKDGGGQLSDVVYGIERAEDPNQDGDFSDKVDVISMSLGGVGSPDDLLSQASDAAVDLGTVVVAAAGNSGEEGYFTLGSPGDARKVISVGASCKPNQISKNKAYLIARIPKNTESNYSDPVIHLATSGSLVDSNSVQNPENILNEDDDYAVFKNNITRCPVNFGFTNADQLNDGPGCAIEINGWESWFSGWAIINISNLSLGEIAKLEFLVSDYNLGCNNNSNCGGPEFVIFGTDNLDGVNTSWQSLGLKVIPKNSDHYLLDVPFLSSGSSVGLCTNDVVQFSSRGPTIYGNVKPDVVAPGHVICAARLPGWNPTGSLPYSTCLDQNHVWLSGTSMAAPHVAGAVALIKQAHPNWTPQKIKDVLKGTAVDFQLSPLTQGAGRIDVLASVNTTNSYPTAILNSDNIFVKGIINITGTAESDNFKQYTLEYGEGLTPSNWTTITTSSSPVQGGILGTINVDNINSKEIMFRLTVENNYSHKNQDNVLLLKKDSSWHDGWPKSIEGDSIYMRFSPTFADLDNDGIPEIIAGTPSITGSKVYVWDINGNLLPGWPQVVNMGGGSTPAVGDVDGDGKKEIVYTSTTIIDPTGGKTTIYVWKIDGTPLNSNWPKNIGNDLVSFNSPTLADIDNDGKDEIIYPHMTYSNGIQIFRGNGTEITGPWNNYGNSGVSVSDIDNDGTKEIIATQGGGFPDDNGLYAWKATGTSLPNFPVKNIGVSFDNSFPVINDVNNDGYKEILLNGMDGSGLATCKMFIIDKNGNVLPGWPVVYTCDGATTQVPQIISGKGISTKIGSISTESSGISYMNYWNLNGVNVGKGNISNTSLWAPKIMPININNESSINFYSSSFDLKDELVKFNVNNNSTVWKKKIFDYPSLSGTLFRSPLNGISLGDFDNNSKLEALVEVYSGDSYAGKFQNFGTQILIIDLDDKAGQITYPTYGLNVKHTGELNLPLCGDSNGDGMITISDAVYLIRYIFAGGSAPDPLINGDVDGNGVVNISDVVYLIKYIFAGGSAPCSPDKNWNPDTYKGWTQKQVIDYMNSLQK